MEGIKLPVAPTKGCNSATNALASATSNATPLQPGSLKALASLILARNRQCNRSATNNAQIVQQKRMTDFTCIERTEKCRTNRSLLIASEYQWVSPLLSIENNSRLYALNSNDEALQRIQYLQKIDSNLEEVKLNIAASNVGQFKWIH